MGNFTLASNADTILACNGERATSLISVDGSSSQVAATLRLMLEPTHQPAWHYFRRSSADDARHYISLKVARRYRLIATIFEADTPP